jgi:ATP-dependent protease HslVU (ClpYQ) peptidase subunit
MTCIVALKENGKIYFGADKALSDAYTMRKISYNKIFKKGKYILGYTGSPRLGQLLEHVIELPEPPKSGANLHFIVSSFIESVRKGLKEYGFSEVDNNKEKGGIFIIGIDGEIFKVYNDFQVSTYENNVICCGSGEDYAEATMEALKDIFPPKERIAKAIEIAGKFITTVTQDCIILEA